MAPLACFGNDLNIDLYTLAWKGHLLVRLRFVDFLSRLRLEVELVQPPIHAARRPLVAALSQSAP